MTTQSVPPPKVKIKRIRNVDASQAEEGARLLERCQRGAEWRYIWYVTSAGEKMTLWLPTSADIVVPAGAKGCNVYFGVHGTATKGRSKTRALAAPDPEKPNSPLVSVVNCLFAEYDDMTLADVLNHIAERGAPPPSMAVHSGGGIHPYWFLRKPVFVTDENRAWMRAVQAAWVDFVGAQPESKDLARVLRLPGMHNMKPERRKDNGPPMVRVVLEHDDEYDIDALATLALAYSPPRPPQEQRPIVERSGDTRYGQAALTNEIEELRRAQQGTRNHTLNKAAYALGQLVAGGEVDEAAVVAELEAAAHAIGLSDGEAAGTIKSGMGAGKQHPRQAPPRTMPPAAQPATVYMNGDGPTQSTAQHSDEPPPSLKHFPTHDSGNADAFLFLNRDRFAWNDAFGWVHWTGEQWISGAEGEAMARRAMERTLLQRTAEFAGSQSAGSVAPTAAKVRSTLAMVQPRVFVRPSTFLDAENKALLNTVSGVVDLRTGAMRSARPEDRFLWCVPTPYDSSPTVDDELWRALVLDWVSGDQDMADYLQFAMGYSITGESSEKCLFFLLGDKGNNGKTTFTRAVTDTLACSIVRGISLDTLTVASRLADPQGFGLAPLIHARYVPASEGDLKGALKGNVLKALTSHGDPMQVAEKGRQPVEWKPTIKLWAMSNHPPRVAGDDPVGWQRFRVIRFDKVYDDAQADPTLGDQLRTPPMRAAILRWLVQGAVQWYAKRLPTPQAVKDATREAALANNSAARFVEECIVKSATGSTTAKDLLPAYLAWCDDNDIDERDRKNDVHLGRALGAAGHEKDGNRRWQVSTASNFAETASKTGGF